MSYISNPVAFTENHFGISLRKSSGNEWVGPCPFCKDGDDRFHVWEDVGNYWCRVCERKGFVDKLADSRPLTEEEKLELRLRKLEAQQREQDRRLSALERMARCKAHLTYHDNLTDEHIEWWRTQGILQDSILDYCLGFCFRCPTDKEYRPSYTIPVINGGTLQNIRHRIADAGGGDKYRPHLPGLGTQLFNADFLNDNTIDDIVLVEGAKKSIVLDQQGIPSVGVLGKQSFKKEWLPLFGGLRTIYITLDPDATEAAKRLATLFEGRARIVNLPVKPDDFFFMYGGSVSDFHSFLKVARPV